MLETGSIMTVYLVVMGTFGECFHKGQCFTSIWALWNWGPKHAGNWFHNDSILSSDGRYTGEWFHKVQCFTSIMELGSKTCWKLVP